MNKKTGNFYSTTEVAQLLHISREAVFKKIQKGQLRAEKIGRNYAILKEDLDAYLGTSLTPEKKEQINKVVKRAVDEYGVTFRRLGKEE